MAKREDRPRDLGQMLLGYVRFREEAALAIFSRTYCQAVVAWGDEARAAETRARCAADAVAAADALVAELERTDESRADHPSRKEG